MEVTVMATRPARPALDAWLAKADQFVALRPRQMPAEQVGGEHEGDPFLVIAKAAHVPVVGHLQTSGPQLFERSLAVVAVHDQAGGGVHHDRHPQAVGGDVRLQRLVLLRGEGRQQLPGLGAGAHKATF
jgi:hypothetical protein